MTRDAKTKPKLPRPGRPQGRFTQHRRLDRLRSALEDHPQGLDIAALSSMLRLSTRSIRRYLRELERQLDLESFARTPGGAHVFRIKPSERARTVSLRRTQAYGLLALRPLYDILKGSALYDEMDVVMRQVEKVAQRPTRAGVKGEAPADQRLEDRFLFVSSSLKPYGAKGEEIDDIFQAVANCRVVDVRLRTPGGDPKGERISLAPYALVVQDGSIHCIGQQLPSAHLRFLPVETMSEVRTTETVFEIPADFKVEHYLQGVLGVGLPGGHPVLIEFDPKAGEAVRSRRIHPTQKMALAKDGRVRLSVLVRDPKALAGWVLSFGPKARVLQPKELADEVARQARELAANYAT